MYVSKTRTRPDIRPCIGPPPKQQLIVSHLQPFGARLDIEIISAPHPVAANRTGGADVYLAGGPIKYVHFIINQVSNLVLDGFVILIQS